MNSIALSPFSHENGGRYVKAVVIVVLSCLGRSTWRRRWFFGRISSLNG